MPVYKYDSINADGTPESGEVQADDVASAILQLQERGLSVEMIQVISGSDAPTVESRSAFHARVQAALEQSDILVPPLVALTEELPSTECDLSELVDLLQTNKRADALIDHDKAAAWLPIVMCAEKRGSGRMAKLLTLATRHRQRHWQRLAMLVYPTLIFVIALLVAFALGRFIIPTFSEMYSEFGLMLPAPTAVVLWVSSQIVNHPTRFLVIVVACFVATVFLTRWWFQNAWSTRLFGSLAAGHTSSVHAMASLTGTLAELLRVEASLPLAMRIAGRGCGHRHYNSQLNEMASFLESGNISLKQTRAARWFPANLMDALQPDSGGQPNVNVLSELSQMYHGRAAHRIDWARWLLGPLAMIFVGGVVGFIVIALFMPLISLVSSLS